MPIGFFVVFGFLAWPFLEIAAFIAVGREVGILGTLALVVLTSLIGAFLLRSQGLAGLARVREDMRRHTLPAESLGHAALIGLGGVLLMLPGFVSDAFAILLFIQPVRHWILATIGRRIAVSVNGQMRASQTVVMDLEPEDWRSEVVTRNPRLRAPNPNDVSDSVGPGPRRVDPS
jgi:UPF0716 protein FxsA